MPRIHRKGPKWQKENSIKIKLVKRNITKETIREIVVDKEIVNDKPTNTNDKSLVKTMGWELFCSIVLGCFVSNLLYTLVNSEGYSIYRITFSESTWYAFLFAIITFVSVHVFISLLYIIKFIIKRDIVYVDFWMQFTDIFKCFAIFSLVIFLVSMLLPISTSIKFGLLAAVVIILFVSVYDMFYKMFANNTRYLMAIFAVAIVVTVLIYILLSGFVQGNFTRL